LNVFPLARRCPGRVVGARRALLGFLGGLLFLSGQIGLDPASGTLVAGGVLAEAEQVMRNLRAVASAAGTSLGNAVRTTIYLVDLADFAAVNEIYQRFLEPPYPARATIGVAALPRGARVEIDAILARG